MSSVQRILRSSANSDPRWGNCGGGRRAAQLGEILSEFQIDTIDDFVGRKSSRRSLAMTALKLRLGSPEIKFRFDRRLIQYLAGDYLRHKQYFECHRSSKFLVEDVIDYARIKGASDAGATIVCCPTNLETLQRVPQADFYSNEGRPSCFDREIRFAGLAKSIFCISREEQWLFHQYGVRADFLPYYPPAEEERRLLNLRDARSAAETTSAVIAIASGENARNYGSLLELADLANAMPVTDAFRLNVGGFATEKMRTNFKSPNCVFHGELSNEKMQELMLHCKAAIVHQSAGAGALTRIPEMLIAGVPVLASPHAARSAYHLNGVYVYHNAAELKELMSMVCEIPPVPERDRAAEKRFVEAFR
jgi:glycosyltransferase involved in cell wall biosynthesis